MYLLADLFDSLGLWSLVVAIAFVMGIVVSSLLWKREVGRAGRTSGPAARDLTGNLQLGKPDCVLSGPEKNLFQMIVYVVGKDSVVFPKVALASLVSVPKNADRREMHMKLLRSRVVDFVLCDPDKLSPTLVVHVGNPNDEDGDRYDDDQAIAESLRMVGIPVLWMEKRETYMPMKVKEQIRDVMARHHAAADAVREDQIGQMSLAKPGGGEEQL